MAKISVMFKDELIQEIPLDEKPLVAGRSQDNDIVLDNLGVSRNHTRIFKEGDDFIVEDLESQNGTLVNNLPVTRSKLQDKDEISIGKHNLIFHQYAEVTPEVKAKLAKKKLRPLRPGTSRFLPPEDTLQLGSGPAPKNKDKTTQRLEKKEWGKVEILEGDSGAQSIDFSKPMILVGKSSTADVLVKGDITNDIVFVLSNRPTGVFMSPPKGAKVEIDGLEVTEAMKLKNGSILQVADTKMKFSID